MSRYDRLRSRLKAEFLGRGFAMVFSSLITIVLARLLDPDDYGLLFFAIAMFAIVEILTKLGIGRSAGRYIAEYKEKDQSQIRYIIKVSLSMNLLSISAVSVVLFLTYQDIIQSVGEPELEPFLIVGLLFIAFSTLETYVRRVLQGFEAIKLTAILQFLHKGAKFVFAIGFVVLGFGVAGALWGYVISYIFVAVTGFALIYFKFYQIHDADSSIESGLVRRIGEYTIPLTVTDTAHIVDEHIDTLLVGILLTPVAVGYYALGKQMSKFAMVPASSIGFTLSPTFGAKKASGNLEEARQIYESTLVYSLLLYVPAAAGLILVAEKIIVLIIGSDYIGAVPVLQVFALYIIVYSITKITSNSLDYLGRAKKRAIVRSLTMALNVVLNILLITTIGVVGAAIATVTSYSIYTLVSMYLIHVELNLRIWHLINRIGMITFISVVMSAVVFIALSVISGIPGLILVIVLGAAVWFLLSVAVGLLDASQIRALSA